LRHGKTVQAARIAEFTLQNASVKSTARSSMAPNRNYLMKTVHKIAIARAIYRLVRAGRSLFGRTDRDIVTRAGITYELDLSQGIDFAIYLCNIYERQTRAALRKLVSPSSLVLDIGANIGAHTLHLAQLVGPAGRVIAFEPTDFAFRKLRRNLELNPDLAPRVTACHCFLTDTDATQVPSAIYSSWPLAQQQGTHAKHLGLEMKTDSAQARSLDSVLAELADRKVQLVKLDVDGFECDVLRGATGLLRDVRPIFVMELSPYVLEEHGTSLEQLLSHFIPNGYVFYDERTARPLPSTASELKKMIGDGAGINAIARVN
jgi:FkbM family methyltransferase